MKRLTFATICILVTLFYCDSCHRNIKEKIFSYYDLQDSLESFVSKAPEIYFPEKTPPFVGILFFCDKSLEGREDTLVVFMKGIIPFYPMNGHKVIGATFFENHICEVIYNGFEHLPGIVNEDILTLSPDGYIKYGYKKERFDNLEYSDWLFTSGTHKLKDLLTRTYRLKRPNILERID